MITHMLSSYVCYAEVIAPMLNPKLIPMVTVVGALNYEGGDTSSSQQKEYLMESFISQNKYGWLVTFTCTT